MDRKTRRCKHQCRIHKEEGIPSRSFYLDSGDKDKNKLRFDQLFIHKAAIEAAVGEPLRWERLDEKRACRVAAFTKSQIFTVESPELFEWAAKKAFDFHKAFAPEFVG